MPNTPLRVARHVLLYSLSRCFTWHVHLWYNTTAVDGKIFVKTSPSGDTSKISTADNLGKLLRRPNHHWCFYHVSPNYFYSNQTEMYPGNVRLFSRFLLLLLISAVVNLMLDAFAVCFVVYNTRCPFYRLNSGLKFISIVQASTVGIFMQEMTNSFILSHYGDANCTLQGFAYVFDVLNHCKHENTIFSDELVIGSLNARVYETT